MVVYHPLWLDERTLCKPWLRGWIKTCRLRRSSQDIARRFTILFTPFDPDLLFLLLFFVRVHTINVCHLLHDQQQKKKKSGPSLTGALLAALSACIWATGSSTGGTGTSSLIISPHHAFNGPLEVMLITWIPTDWHGWRTQGHNLYFMHFAWSGNEGIKWVLGLLLKYLLCFCTDRRKPTENVSFKASWKTEQLPKNHLKHASYSCNPRDFKELLTCPTLVTMDLPSDSSGDFNVLLLSTWQYPSF